MKKKILGLLTVLAPMAVYAQTNVTSAATFATAIGNSAGDITTALWAAAGAFIVVLVAYISIKAVLKGAKAVS